MKLSAVLLAGGESRRMGRDKATLDFRGEPLWQRQLDLLRKLRPAEIFISARGDPSWRPDDVPFVRDTLPSRGPLSGLAATFAQMRGTHLLALAIDMPFMTEQWLRWFAIQPSVGAASSRRSAIDWNRWPLFIPPRRALILPRRSKATISHYSR